MTAPCTKLPPNEYADGRYGPGSAHWVAYETNFGPVPPGCHVHHVNGLKYDNRPDNLMALPKKFHKWLHRNQLSFASLVRRGSLDRAVTEFLLKEHLDGRLLLDRGLSATVADMVAATLSVPASESEHPCTDAGLVLPQRRAKNRHPVRCENTGEVFPTAVAAARRLKLKVADIYAVLHGHKSDASGMRFARVSG